ncbi:uncharacterized protein LOC117173068 [Belonocnema kinseyi]|uniref:uncharacterized protein LOC117173068 n=1 Tax=Belonocnema kinseyi TaxID=2817044 RepID=UPI00143D99FE|nr:uncharacterized protein LOC117173068 [Belonocnema kinseyi]
MSSESSFHSLILQVSNKKLGPTAYRRRAEILMELFVLVKDVENCILIPCETTIEYMVTKLMENYPSFKEQSVCKNKECPTREKKNVNIILDVAATMLKDDFNSAIENEMVLDLYTKCPVKWCNDYEETQISETGSCIFI